jgi:hypothetical protein
VGMKLLQYLAMSFGWLISMAIWPLLVIPQIDPRCSTSTSFGFLPATMVVPFLTLLLYAASVAVHAVYAFRQQRFKARERGKVPLFGLDAAFFIPFSLLSLMALMSITNWNSSSHCFFMALAIALPWIATPVVNTRLLARASQTFPRA